MKIKRLLCLVLGLFMFAACGCSGVEEASLNESAVGESSNEESKEEKPSIDTVHTEYTNAIDTLLNGHSDRSLNYKNLLKGLSYQASLTASPEYPDNKKLLTDGANPDKFSSDGSWAGYMTNSGATNIVEFDLGSVKEDLLDFSVNTLEYIDYGIYAPTLVKFYVAGADKNYIQIGTAYRPDGTLGQNALVEYRISLQKSIKARYVRYEIVSKRSWLFIGEISALSYSESLDTSDSANFGINDYYGYKPVAEIKTPEYWDKSDSDYKTKTNLIKSKKPTIYSKEAVEANLLTDWYNGRNTNILTDGVKSTKATYSDTAWYHVTQGYARSITYDLTKTSAVSGFSIGFLRDSGVGVEMPAEIGFYISENGIDWQCLYFLKNLVAEKENDIARIDESFEKSHKARYVRIDFCLFSHAFIDEITVTGTKDITGALDVVPDVNDSEESEGSYLMPEDFYGVNNMLLSYHCSLDNSNVSTESGRISVDEYLPYIAYLDKNGKIKDTFFDSVLYLPYVNMLHDNQKSVYGRSAQGWKNYVDDMFYPDRNMNALEQCAEKVYTELGITDQKIKVFTSILYTFPKLMDGSKNNFGDIDGDGKNEDFSTIEGRKKAIKWLMDEEYKRFNANGYKNLEFCGYYWFEEAIDYNDPHEKELIRFAVDYAHTLGVKVFWIPYRTASGVGDWAELGFDAACLQPNYMFSSNGSADTLYNTATRAKRLGMCVELEISDAENSTDARKFIEYLNAGAETGYMQAVKMYYQNGVPGAFYNACYSKNELARLIYDSTYLFAKEKYEPIRSEDSVILQETKEYVCKSGGSVNGKINLDGLDTLLGRLVVTVSPKYGSLKLNSDGTFTYYSADGYKGLDSFSVAFDMGYGEPTDVEITIVCE